MSLSLESPVVPPDEVAANLADPRLRIVDCRWYLSGPRSGRSEYGAGHLPGAVFVDVHSELAQHPGPGRHPLPDAEAFTRVARRIGIDPDTTVVAYDDCGGACAARLWWLLRHYGHHRVAVLDGGIQRWIAEGGSLETSIPEYPPGGFTTGVGPYRAVDRATVASRPAGAVLIDARATERFRGDVEPIDPRAGHIPGAVNLPHAGNLTAGSFRSPESLHQRYAPVGADNAPAVIVYCGSGVTACHNLLALELAGIRGALLYEGSWSDWCSDPGAPVATGGECAG